MTVKNSALDTPRAYLIGGPARVGKSTLASLLNKEINAYRITADVLVLMLFNAHVLPDPHIELEPKATWLERLVARDQRVWPYIKSLITSTVTLHNESIIVDGAFYPDFLSEMPLEIEYRHIVMVDTSPVAIQAERMIQIRDSSSVINNWHKSRSYSDEKIRAWTELNRHRSLQYVAQAKAHGVKIFDVAAYSSQTEMQEAALSWLCS